MSHWKRGRAGLLLVVLVLVAYWPVTNAGFVIDDKNYVYENPTLRDAGGLARIWSDVHASPQYYPLVFTSFWIEYQLWGDAPLGYHVTNVILHALNALLVWLLLRRLAVPGAWLGAALFALHPVHVESVAWVAERKNVLSVAFYLMSALAYLRFAALDGSSPPGRWRHWLLGLALFAAALASKTATVSLPAALLLVVWWKRGRVRPADAAALVPFFLLAAGMGLVTIWIETTRGGASGELWDLSWPERFIVAGRALAFYAAKLAWPLGLSFDYGRWTIDDTVPAQYVWPLLVAGVLVALGALRHRIGRGPLVAVLFFAGTLAPTLGFFDVYYFRYSYVADHFLYPASLGLLALAAAGAARLGPRLGRARGAAGGALLAILLAQSVRHVHAFESLETLCLHTLRENPTSWLANNNLGDVHLKRGELDEAVARFETARETAPAYVETHLNLAIAETNRGNLDRAEEHARRAIELRPQNRYGWYLLGDVQLRAGRPAEAVGSLRESLARDPDWYKAQLRLAVALTRTGRADEAVGWFEKVLGQDPDNVAALGNSAIALAERGRFGEATRRLERALRLEPDNDALRRNLDAVRRRAEAAGEAP